MQTLNKAVVVSETNWDTRSDRIQWHNNWQNVYSVMVGISNMCHTNFETLIL
jgi:hypothetical protein